MATSARESYSADACLIPCSHITQHPVPPSPIAHTRTHVCTLRPFRAVSCLLQIQIKTMLKRRAIVSVYVRGGRYVPMYTHTHSHTLTHTHTLSLSLSLDLSRPFMPHLSNQRSLNRDSSACSILATALSSSPILACIWRVLLPLINTSRSPRDCKWRLPC